MHDNKAYPYPEIVTGDEWTVNEVFDGVTPHTDNLNKQMTVPLDRECEKCGLEHSKTIRRHELGHAKWSPKTMGKLPKGVRAEAIEVLEEIRINYLLFLEGLGLNGSAVCHEEVKMRTTQMIYKASISRILLYGLACFGWQNTDKTRNNNKYQRSLHRRSNDYLYEYQIYSEVMRKAIAGEELSELRKTELDFVLSQVGYFSNKLLSSRGNYQTMVTYKKVQKIAKELSIILDAFMDKPNPEDVHAPKPTNTKSNMAETEAGEESEDEMESTESSGDVNKHLKNRMKKELVERMQYQSSPGVGYWGNMTKHEPSLTVNLQGRLKNGRDYRPADIGYNPKYINRYCLDRKIFKQKQRVKGGTILIDASGSMQFDGNDILQIMEMLPAVNIAMYNGYGNSGNLRIIAKNGMRVDDTYLDEHSGAGNVIDGPALRWLADMPERRIWVSDMHVFGASGSASNGFNLFKECLNICTQNNIINLKDIDEVKEHALKLNM
jgi:hypothetical protein